MTSIMNLPAIYSFEVYNKSSYSLECCELFIDGVSHSFYETKQEAEQAAREHFANQGE